MALDIAKARNLGASFLSYNFEMVFPEIPGVTPTDLEELSLRCHSSALPGFTSESYDRWFKKVRTAREPGRTTWDPTWEAIFREGDKLQVYKMMITWRKAIGDPSTGAGEGAGPKADVILNLLDESGAQKLKVKMIGVMPEVMPPLTLAWEGGEPGDLAVTFSLDDIELTFSS